MSLTCRAELGYVEVSALFYVGRILSIKRRLAFLYILFLGQVHPANDEFFFPFGDGDSRRIIVFLSQPFGNFDFFNSVSPVLYPFINTD